jgi:HSP20 family molecular chaperone IbpA
MADKGGAKKKAEEVRTEVVCDTGAGYSTPAADVYETDEAIVVEADMPGVDRSGVDVKIDNGLLTIRGRGERKQIEGVTQLYDEFVPCDYCRAFTIDVPVDESRISAGMKNGVLTVTLPKSGSARIRKIEVK